MVVNRWSDWIENIEYQKRLQVIEDHVSNTCRIQTTPNYYTPHDANHCLAVEKIIKALLLKSDAKDRLSDLEKFILFAASWTHDIGMFKTIGQDFFLRTQNNNNYTAPQAREIHDEISAWYLANHFRDVFAIGNENVNVSPLTDEVIRSYAYSINMISKYHRMKNDIKDCPKEKISQRGNNPDTVFSSSFETGRYLAY